MLLWYLRRAVPWVSLLGCLGIAAPLVAVAGGSRTVGAFAMLLAALLVAASAAFVYDEPAAEVATVTPRGSRWARAARSASVAVPLLTYAGLTVTVRDKFAAGDWMLTAATLACAAMLAALVGVRRRVPRPGSVVAPVVLLLGLAPTVVAELAGIGSPYPAPAFSDVERVGWAAALAAGAFGIWAGGSLANRRKPAKTPYGFDQYVGEPPL